MESLTTYMAEHGLVYPVVMMLTVVSSVLAGIAIYYRMTYGTVRKCRFCLSIGKLYDVKPGKECSECGNLHIPQDCWTDLDDRRVANHKSTYYINKERLLEERRQQEKQIERDRFWKQQAVKIKNAEDKKAQEAAEAEKARLVAEKQTKVDALRRIEAKMVDTIHPGQVVRVLHNRCHVRAKNPYDDRQLAPGDLIQVDDIFFKESNAAAIYNGERIEGCQVVSFRRYQGRLNNHLLPLIDVEPTTKEDLLPGRYARLKKTAMHLPHPTDPKASLPVDSIIRIASISSDHSAVNYRVARYNGIGSINPKWLQLVIDPVDYVQPGDTVRVIRNEVNANSLSSTKECAKELMPGEEVVVHSVHRKGVKCWPYKDYDVITYLYPHHMKGMNFLPLYDVELVEPKLEEPVSPVVKPDSPHWSKLLDKWYLVPAGLNGTGEDTIGLCKQTNECDISIAFYDRYGVLQEIKVTHGAAKVIHWLCSDFCPALAEKITREWTGKFFIPRFKSNRVPSGATSPNIEILLPTAMWKKISEGHWLPRTTDETKAFEKSVRKELEKIYENQIS